MTVSGQNYDKDLIILPQEVLPDWWRKEGHALVAEDLNEVFVRRVDTLIVGTGASGMMRIPETTRQTLEKKGIRLIAMITAAAVSVFNDRMKRGENLAGAFHLTC